MNQTQGTIDTVESMNRLLDHLHIVFDQAQYRRLLDELTRPDRPRIVSFLNQHGFNLSWRDTAFRETLQGSDVLLCDGVGVAACLRMLGRSPGINMNGTDLIPQLAKAYAGRRAAVVGTKAPYTERAVQWLRNAGLDIVYVAEGFAEAASYLPAISAARPDLLICGMGMPKQELTAALLAEALDHPILIVNGGAILDFLAGRFARAPRLLRRLRLEWLYRLVREPRRLWRRYLLGGGYFIARTLRLCLAPGNDANHANVAAVETAPSTPWPSRSRTPTAVPLLPPDGLLMTGLAQRIDTALATKPHRIVQFIAARTGEGVSSIAHSYAQAAALLHDRKVLLVSDDLNHSESLPCLVDGELAGPFVSASVHYVRLSNQSRSHQDNLRALAEPSIWAALLASFDEVVLDASPPFDLPLVNRADGVLVVVEAEATRAATLHSLLNQLKAANAFVLGTVLNKRHDYLPRFLHDRL